MFPLAGSHAGTSLPKDPFARVSMRVELPKGQRAAVPNEPCNAAGRPQPYPLPQGERSGPYSSPEISHLKIVRRATSSRSLVAMPMARSGSTSKRRRPDVLSQDQLDDDCDQLNDRPRSCRNELSLRGAGPRLDTGYKHTRLAGQLRLAQSCSRMRPNGTSGESATVKWPKS